MSKRRASPKAAPKNQLRTTTLTLGDIHEDWTITYNPKDNQLVFQGEGNKVIIRPGELRYDDERLDDDWRESLEQDNSLANNLKIELWVTPYNNDSGFEDNTAFQAFIDALAIRLVLDQRFTDTISSRIETREENK